MFVFWTKGTTSGGCSFGITKPQAISQCAENNVCNPSEVIECRYRGESITLEARQNLPNTCRMLEELERVRAESGLAPSTP